ncbi:MAG: hypothetical protein LBK06_00160 [Planctomycetaceae bacterium]|nr:hypothetical protein [Planctomycetaceae bacterium]
MSSLTGRNRNKRKYAEAVLKFAKLNTAAQQREAVTRGRSLLPYRLRYKVMRSFGKTMTFNLVRNMSK